MIKKFFFFCEFGKTVFHLYLKFKSPVWSRRELFIIQRENSLEWRRQIISNSFAECLGVFVIYEVDKNRKKSQMTNQIAELKMCGVGWAQFECAQLKARKSKARLV